MSPCVSLCAKEMVSVDGICLNEDVDGICVRQKCPRGTLRSAQGALLEVPKGHSFKSLFQDMVERERCDTLVHF